VRIGSERNGKCTAVKDTSGIISDYPMQRLASAYILVTCSSQQSQQDEQLPLGRLDKCEGKETQISGCNLDECQVPECIDCQWAPWDDWGSCACTGLRERGRDVQKRNNYCGKPCAGSKVETKRCSPDCFQPVRDCIFGTWGEWGKCNRTCGVGQRYRERIIKTFLEEDGTPCKGASRETGECHIGPCNAPVACELTDWEDWSECSVSCGGGQQHSIRRIKRQSKFDGPPCSDVLTKISGCNTQPCSEAVDCVWGNWDVWSACSRTCDGGERTRSRLIDIAPRSGGKLCDAVATAEVETCNRDPCKDVQDCEMTEWSKWDSCSATCNGVRHRMRSISKFPRQGGKACNGSLKEIDACNADDCEKPKEVSVPVDCVFGVWEGWSDCPVTCGSSQRTRMRLIESSPQNGGNPCVGEMEVTEVCGEAQCPTEEEEMEKKVVGCELSEWSKWSDCSASCGGGERQRNRKLDKMPTRHGERCQHESIHESEQCGMGECNCTDCKWALWSEWGACTCTGLKERHRNILQHYEKCGHICEGTKSETATCKPECQSEPLDCQLATWSGWSECSVTCGGGQIFRQRGVQYASQNGGNTCKAGVRETKKCNVQKCETPIDCVVGEWSEWNECTATCGGGQQNRERHVKTLAVGDGKPCTKALSEIQGCAPEVCHKNVDCVWGAWSEWSACTFSCGGGQKTRDRRIETAPRHSGTLCDEFPKTELAPCNEQECDKTCIDGKLSEWDEWSLCSASCDTGFQYRVRKIEQEPNFCGKQIAEKDAVELQQFAACVIEPCSNYRVDCVFSEWMQFGDCSCSADGVRDRSRTIETYQSNGGMPCVGAMKEVEPCNEGKGLPDVVDCRLTDWSEWSQCSVTCDGGIQERERDVKMPPSGGGKDCEKWLHEVKGCKNDLCKTPVDCAWEKWGDWGGCSVHCGGGQMNRYRHVTQMPKHNGVPCKPHESAEVKGCNLEKCELTKYCQWEPWTVWTTCSKPCGGGEKKRARNLVISTSHHLETMEGYELIPEALNVTSPDALLFTFVAGMVFASLLFTTTLFACRRHRRNLPEEGAAFNRLIPDEELNLKLVE